jgi:DNA-binding protein
VSQEQAEEEDTPTGTKIELSETVKTEAKEVDVNQPMSVLIGQGSQLRRLISAAIARVKANQTVTLKAFGRNQHRAVTLASIVRDRVGDLHQLNSFVEEKNEKEGKERLFVGIQIILSAEPLDTEDPGYQKPKPKGAFMAQMP